MWRGNFCRGRGWSEGGASALVAIIRGGVAVTTLCRTCGAPDFLQRFPGLPAWANLCRAYGAELWTGVVNGVRGSDFAKRDQGRPPEGGRHKSKRNIQVNVDDARLKSRRSLQLQLQSAADA